MENRDLGAIATPDSAVEAEMPSLKIYLACLLISGVSFTSILPLSFVFPATALCGVVSARFSVNPTSIDEEQYDSH
jgi:hypothetical protein